MAKRYTDEFKADAVALVRQGALQWQVCQDLGISKTALSKWVHEAERSARGLPRPVSKEENAGMRELMKRNRLLEQENEVLRRAAAYLSQGHLPK